MGRLEVALPGGTYPVLVGEGTMAELPGLIDASTGVVAIVTDHNVGPLWTPPLVGRLRGAGLTVTVLEVVAGEPAKSFTVFREVLEFLERSQVDRRGLVVALGGGTIGDLAGFAAATWLRGVAYYQVPTTLLAMVDSSVGGKTAIDTDRTKNSVGAFWQPRAVIADLTHLSTLPEDHYLAAYAEIVKYGVSLDADLFELLSGRLEELISRSIEVVESVVMRSVAAKARVVVADERESGWRQVLNYGHTVGHALEVQSGYRLAHGRAVAAGMRTAGWISARLGLCDQELIARQDRLLAAFGLPGPLPMISIDETVAAMRRDKKAVRGEVDWVLLKAMGRAEVGHRVPAEMAIEAVTRLVQDRL